MRVTQAFVYKNSVVLKCAWFKKQQNSDQLLK